MLEILNLKNSTLKGAATNAKALEGIPMDKQAFTVTELMREIGIGRSKLYQEMSEGKLKARKIGRKTIFLAKDVEVYLNSLPAKAA